MSSYHDGRMVDITVASGSAAARFAHGVVSSLGCWLIPSHGGSSRRLELKPWLEGLVMADPVAVAFERGT
jgi:hypothetical protein